MTGDRNNAESLDRCAVVVPALNPSDKLTSFICELSELGFKNIIVINDGSDFKFSHVFRDLEQSGHCIVLTHDRNMGKGAALKTAFEYFLRNFGGKDMCGVITADADGQHLPDDVLSVANALCSSTNSIIMGSRNFRQDNVPQRSRLGNTFISKAFRWLYGVSLSDTQTGLRGIPLPLIEKAESIYGSRYEYEINVLILAKKQGIKFVEVPISTIYFDNNESSHYHPFSDSMRILWVLFAGLLRYFYASIISSIVDVGLFIVLNYWVFALLSTEVRLFWATAIARVASSAVNFVLNKKTFAGTQPHPRTQLIRYYILWIIQLLAAYLMVYGLSFIIPSDAVSKLVTDNLLALFSYQIQLRWVYYAEPAE